MLQIETVKPELLKRLRELITIKELEKFYLVGGTALCLLYGHRDLVDIDLFTHDNFDSDFILKTLSTKYNNIELQGLSNIFLFRYLDNLKIDFVNKSTPLQYSIKTIEGVRIADEKDFTALKLKDIFQRGSKKDFVDLYLLLQHFCIEELIELFYNKYPNINIGQLLLSMNYFIDAEETQMHKIYFNTNWENTKKTNSSKVINYLNQ